MSHRHTQTIDREPELKLPASVIACLERLAFVESVCAAHRDGHLDSPDDIRLFLRPGINPEIPFFSPEPGRSPFCFAPVLGRTCTAYYTSVANLEIGLLLGQTRPVPDHPASHLGRGSPDG